MRLDRITKTTNILKRLVEIYMTLKRINAGHGVREYDMHKRKQVEDDTKSVAHRAMLDMTKDAINDLVTGAGNEREEDQGNNAPRSVPSMKEIFGGGPKP
jgi:hypothetical protein